MQTRPQDVHRPTGPFEAGPYRWLAEAVEPARDFDRPWRRALLFAAVCWLPLVVLAALEGLLLSSRRHESLLLDFDAQTRYLVAGPAFIIAAGIYQPLLSNMVRQFLECGMITDTDRPRYDAVLESTRRILASRWTDIAVLAFAYAVTFIVGPWLYPPDVSTWVVPLSRGSARPSLAGWWRVLVSQPLFQVLLWTWVCRVLLWIRFLWVVSRLNLQLVASHPDCVGGLRFMLQPLGGFALLAFGTGAMLAGSVAADVITDGKPLRDFRYIIGAQVVGNLVLFTGPLLLLMPSLLTLKTRGTNSYGRLAAELGHQFEAKWVVRARHASVEADSLRAQDFSTTTDLFSIVANVRNIRPYVMDMGWVLAFVIATLLPYLPLLFAVMPLDEIFGAALKAIT